MNQDYCVIKTTCKSRREAKKIVKILLEAKLIACSNIIAIESCYNWQNKIVEQKEFLTLLKTKSVFYQEIKKVIISNHSYNLPEITMINIDNGFEKYFDWIGDSLKK